MIVRCAIALALAVSCGAVSAQSVGSSVGRTAGITAPPRSITEMPATQGMNRAPVQDSKLAGGVLTPPQSWSGTFTTGSGSGSGGGGGLAAPIAPALNTYVASDKYSHDVNATLTLTIASSGACTVQTTAQKISANNRTFACGNVVPSGGSGSNYEVMFIANVTVVDNVPFGSSWPDYTPTTAWLDLSAPRGVLVDTGHIVGGGAEDGNRTLSGNYVVRVRAKGSTSYVEGTMQFTVTASSP